MLQKYFAVYVTKCVSPYQSLHCVKVSGPWGLAHATLPPNLSGQHVPKMFTGCKFSPETNGVFLFPRPSTARKPARSMCVEHAAMVRCYNSSYHEHADALIYPPKIFNIRAAPSFLPLSPMQWDGFISSLSIRRKCTWRASCAATCSRMTSRSRTTACSSATSSACASPWTRRRRSR